MTEGRTGGEAASEEHVEEILRRDVGLKASVKLKSPVSPVSRAAGLFCSTHIVLPSLLRVTQHCVRVPDLYTTTTTRQGVKTITQQQQRLLTYLLLFFLLTNSLTSSIYFFITPSSLLPLLLSHFLIKLHSVLHH